MVQLQDHERESMVLCNPPALKQAIAELIANALTFSPENGVVAIEQWRSGGSVMIRIVDEGPGIPEDRLAEALRAKYVALENLDDRDEVAITLQQLSSAPQ